MSGSIWSNFIVIKNYNESIGGKIPVIFKPQIFQSGFIIFKKGILIFW
jgi:hypothetical protein